MRTNIDIDENLISKAMKILNVKTKKEAVDLALKEVLRDNARLEMLKMRGAGWGWEEVEGSVADGSVTDGSVYEQTKKQPKVKQTPAQKQSKTSHAN